jgi:hypothetical protein
MLFKQAVNVLREEVEQESGLYLLIDDYANTSTHLLDINNCDYTIIVVATYVLIGMFLSYHRSSKEIYAFTS